MNENHGLTVDVPVSNGERRKAYTVAERVLLPVSLVIAVLFDRLMIKPFTGNTEMVKVYAGAFWLCWIVIFYIIYWKKLRKNKALWFVAGCSAALCVWNFVFRAGNDEYSFLTYLVVPAVLMAHAQVAAGGYSLKDTGRAAKAWVLGWLVKPFSGIPALTGAASSLVSDGNRPTAKRVGLGVLVTLLLFSAIIPLLIGADQVFGYYLRRVTADINLQPLFLHLLITAIAFVLFHSFIWNVGFGKNEAAVQPEGRRIDKVVCGIVLGAVALLYVLFCGVQFTYLFAGAGLPDGMTYSSYAREGFAQTVAVCSINLIIFGVFLRFGVCGKLLTGLLGGLLGLTGFMLVSGFVRLNLYVGAYGLTWLRLLSTWFIIYLAAVVLLCAIRLLKEKLPVFALCALLLLGWYVTLGYADPDRIVTEYNYNHSYDLADY